MTKNEIAKLLSLATGNFPNLQEKNLKPTAILWQTMLSDMPYELAQQALIKVLSFVKYFPTIAEIRQAAVELTSPQQLSASEAWELVIKAIRFHGYYSEQEALESLPPQVATMVKRFGWQNICKSDEPEIIRAQFRMAWETQNKTDKNMAVLPEPLKLMVQGIGKKTPHLKEAE